MNAYTYLIGWTALGKFYYGCQYNRKANPDDLWTKYFTSSSHVAQMRQEHGEPDIVEVRKTFGDDASACRKWEERVLMRLKKNRLGLWLNKKAGSSKWFNPIGANLGRKLSDESREKISAKLKGRTVPADVREKMSASLAGRPGRKKSAKERAAVAEKNRGYVSAVNIDTGQKIRVTKEEFEANASLRGHSSGTGHAQDDSTKKKISDKLKGTLTAYDIDMGGYRRVTREEFAANPNLKGPRWKPR